MTVDGRTLLRLQPEEGRVTVSIVLPHIERTVDVSAHPAAACAVLHQASRERGRAPDALEPATRVALAEAAAEAGAQTAPPDAPLLAALGGASFPVLASAYARGAAPLAEVTRWAVPMLRAATAREAAAIAFDGMVTRPVVAAFAGCLVHPEGGAAQLWRPAIARMASQVLEPDLIARVLSADGPARPATDVPDRALIDHARPLMIRWGAHRTKTVLVDACASDEGPRLLAETVRLGVALGAHAPQRLPNHLQELHTLYRSRTVTDPTPADAPTRRRAPAPAAATVEDRATRLIERAFHPPAARPAPAAATTTSGPASRHTAIATPAHVRPLDGVEVGSLRIVLPRTCGDLQRWSRLLGNCLDTYGRAAVQGDSVIIGVERDGSLRYALELTRVGVLRQFLGPFNRAPDEGDRAAIVRMLVEHHIVDPRHPGNRPWVRAAGALTA